MPVSMSLARRLPTPAPARLAPLARLCSVAVAGVLTATLLPAAAAPAATGRVIPRQFFGMHDSDLTSWPAAKVGAVRLWDSGTSWREVETSDGVFDWSRLDAQVQAANARAAEVTLVLGQTPAFHVQSGPTTYGYAGEGAPQMPTEASWRRYVHEVASRYTGRPGSSGRIHALQVWNEANVVGFWTGTPADMARLTYWTRSELNGVNKVLPKANRFLLVSPAFVARSNTSYIDKYWKQTSYGSTMNSLVDKVSVSLYPPSTATPEFSVESTRQGLAAFKAILARRKVTKPIWNTEINYGLMPGGNSQTASIGTERQAAYVVRTYLLNAAAKVERVFWYSWGKQDNANTIMTTTSGTPTLAGRALNLTQSWLAKTRLQGCSAYRKGAFKGTYVCTLTYKTGVKRIYWNPTRTVKRFPMPASATYSINLYGRATKIKGGSKKTIDYRPVLVRSKK